MVRYKLWLIEDDAVQRASIENLIASSSLAPKFDLTSVISSEDFKNKLLTRETPDIVLSDIDLGIESPTGVDLAEAFFNSKNTKIIYTTAYLNLVTSVYRTNHVYTLAKPFTIKELELALSQAIQAIEKDSLEFITCTAVSGIKKIFCSSILWLESHGHTVEIHTCDDVIKVRDSLKSLAEKLSTSFVKTHKSYIANLAHVLELAKNELVMTNNSRVPVSRNYRRAVKEQLIGYLALIS